MLMASAHAFLWTWSWNHVGLSVLLRLKHRCFWRPAGGKTSMGWRQRKSGPLQRCVSYLGVVQNLTVIQASPKDLAPHLPRTAILSNSQTCRPCADHII